MTTRAMPLREDQSTLAKELERRIAGRSTALQTLRERVIALAPLDVPVLIRGEPGTGRRHVAQRLHAVSTVSRLPLAAVDCGGGGASNFVPSPRKLVYLHEVSALPQTEQLRWNALLQRGEVGKDGAPRRVLASSGRDLHALARQGEFDAELAARLSRFTLVLPALRERRRDVPDLVRALSDRAAGAMGRTRVHWTREALRLLAAQSWPGNVRELQLVVERLVAFSGDGRINRAQVAELLEEAPVGVVSSRRSALRRQREELVALIDEAGGNLAEVARRLDMSRGGVIYRAQKFGLLPKRSA